MTQANQTPDTPQAPTHAIQVQGTWYLAYLELAESYGPDLAARGALVWADPTNHALICETRQIDAVVTLDRELAQVDDLPTLSAKATPGHWYQTGQPWFNDCDGIIAGTPDGNVADPVAWCDPFDTRFEKADEDGWIDPDDDARFISVLVNAYREGRLVVKPQMEGRP